MGIDLIPMPFFVDGETYLEGKDCTPETFFQRMKAGAEISTSQPAPEEITSLWDTLLKTHDAVLHFPMSSGLSGSCHTAKALAQEYGGRVLVVDDRRISVTLAQSIRNAQVLLAQGKTAAEVRDILEAERDASSVYIAVNTLEYLRKSGRVTAAGAAMAAVLHIKPVLQIQGGKLDAYKKVRGMLQAKKTLLEAYSRPRQNGVNAITLREDDGLIQVCMTNGNNEVIIANRNGRAIRFHESAVRVMGRTASGVKGMTLDEDNTDEVVGMICIKDKEKETVLVVSEQGYGKRSSIEDYRITNRGGKGVKTINITEKTGKLVAIKNVTDENDLMIINKSGIAIRMKVADLNVIGRATQGVRLINLEKRNDEIASVCKVLSESEEEIAEQKAEQEARQENEGRELSENQASLGTDVDLPESEMDNELDNNEEITE